MSNEYAGKLREALALAIRKEVGADPVDRERLAVLRDSFYRVLETARSDDAAVADIAFRAQLAAAFEAIYQDIHAASETDRD